MVIRVESTLDIRNYHAYVTRLLKRFIDASQFYCAHNNISQN